MRLILLLFMSGSMFLTSTAMAKNQANIVCKCNICVVEGKFAGKYFKGYAEHTKDNRIKGSAYPEWAKAPVKALLLVPHPKLKYLKKTCSNAGFNCTIMIMQCPNIKPQSMGPIKPKMGPAEPAENPIIKTGDRITRPPKPSEDECV